MKLISTHSSSFSDEALSLLKSCSLIILFLLFTPSLNAQTLTGSVVGDDGYPLVGAYVLSNRSDNHAHTDETGKFMLLGTAVGDTLLFTYLGYRPLRMRVNDLNKAMRVTLEEAALDLGSVTVRNSSRTTNIVSDIDLQLDPVQSSQEILRKVPGLFIGQHAGGGKAEQIFLRGFDIDHGTDIALSVDGMPVNMVSHAHGQGYADLHFVIPETIEKIDFGKGTYYADQGNFNTAGYVSFQTKDRLKESMVGFDLGQFNTVRGVAMLNLLDTFNQSAYVAAEFLNTDGPVDSPQNFQRTNVMGKYTSQTNGGTKFSVLASHFQSTWDASGQIPQRAVDSGLITRFGAIDDTEGGKTSRTNVALNAIKPLENGAFLKSNAYYSLYDFELFSNFTFFLEDPVNGDQIRQVEDRNIFGLESSYNKREYIGSGSVDFRLGAGLRSDVNNGVGLSRTANRKTLLENIQLGDIKEKNFYGYASAKFEFGDFSIEPALRYDFFQFNYVSQLDSLYDNQTQRKGTISPKLNLIYELSPNVQLFAKTGIGFHSNDTRVVLEDEEDILPAAYSADLGATFKPAPRLIANVALWYLFLEQEFVYVGDAGIVEPSGQTRRQGLDLGFRYQLTDWLFADGDYTYTKARAIEEAEDSDRIPLAPVHTATGGISIQQPKYRAALQARYLGDRAANEDNSIVAEGYTVVDLNGSYDFGKLTLGFAIENLLDVEWNETQFATESRLRNEAQPVEEIHFTPGTPFFFKSTIRYRF